MKTRLLGAAVLLSVTWATTTAADAKTPASLVRKEVQRLEKPRRGTKIRVTDARLGILPGLGLFEVTVLVPDHPGYRCVVYKQNAWCLGDGRLAKVVAAFSLGSKPAQLTDQKWIRLCVFITGATPLRTAGKARLLAGYAPAKAQAKITPPRVTRKNTGVRISYFVELVAYSAYPSGPKTLQRVDIQVTPGNTATVTRRRVWRGF